MDLDIELQKRLDSIYKVFDINEIILKSTGIIDIQKYYRINKIPYSLLHNRDGFVHMGISRGKKYRKEDLFEQPKLAAYYIKELEAENVLELGTGKGASSYYLAKLFPNVRFYGIDLPDGQFDVAKKKAGHLNNFFPEEGDYHDLRRYKKDNFDVVFIFEALCHSNKKWLVIHEVNRILKPGGVFIIADGYSGKEEEKLTKTEILAKNLTGKGMCVGEWEEYNKVRTTILNAGFELISEEDVSKLIIPNLERFEKMAAVTIFDHPYLGYWFVKLFPKEFRFNAVSGYLMPTVIKMDLAKYYISVFQKRPYNLL